MSGLRLLLFLKAHVKGYSRHTKSGKLVFVEPYENKKKKQPDNQLSLLFGPKKPGDMTDDELNENIRAAEKKFSGLEDPEAWSHLDDYNLQSLLNEHYRRLREAQAKRNQSIAAIVDQDTAGFYRATGIDVAGDNPRIRQVRETIARLPESHRALLAKNDLHVYAVREVDKMSPDHPYAPNMAPAGLFTMIRVEPADGRSPYSMPVVWVGDVVSMPDGSSRRISGIEQVTRHEIGHAIDRLSWISGDQDYRDAIDTAVAKMTPEERNVALYFIGNNAPDIEERKRATYSETFAELYSFTFRDNEQAVELVGAFGGLGRTRIEEIFGPVQKIIRSKIKGLEEKWMKPRISPQKALI